MKKIAFFDIDGTLTSEIDGSLPKSAINAIRHARTFGHLMFINTAAFRTWNHVSDGSVLTDMSADAAQIFSVPAQRHCTLHRHTALPCSC